MPAETDTAPPPLLPLPEAAEPVEWVVALGPVTYPHAVASMEQHVASVAPVAASQAGAAERVWLVEHPPLYTAGTSAKPGDLLMPDRLPVFKSGRGGQYTYHGPGQRVAYVMLDLNRRGRDIRRFVSTLEEWIIRTLAVFDIGGERRGDRIGIWVPRPDKGAGSEDKIAAVGIRIRHWVTFHGIAINIDPDLDHFAGIVPCGVRGQGVTSFADLGRPASMTEVDAVLRREFEGLFGQTRSIGSAG